MFLLVVINHQVYIPPRAELRGGAWVVVDPSINPRAMEMYAAPSARGGVLEPSGTIAVKFRAKQQLEAAHRLDPALRALHARREELLLSLSSAAGAADGDGQGQESATEQLAKIKAAQAQREKSLGAVFTQVRTRPPAARWPPPHAAAHRRWQPVCAPPSHRMLQMMITSKTFSTPPLVGGMRPQLSY